MAKRELTADGGALIKSPSPPKAQERELDRAVSYMISEITERYKNNVIGGLHKSTVEKFADAQQGNYAKILVKLAKQTNRRLLRQFDDGRIEQLVNDVLSKVDKRNQQELYQLVERRVGIPSTELIATEGLKSNINALRLETAQWVKKLRDDTLSEYTANTLREMAIGGSLEDVMKNFAGMAEKRKNHAKFTARNQISNFNAITGKIRAQNLGITKAIWRTAKDERVRHSHIARDGKEFDLSKGLYSSLDGKWLMTGIDFQCRCYSEFVIPED
ncbi:MAG: hypothetical protein JKY80_02110 [Mariprofundaceae bacterium]|nr:hypothetical protein [Methylophaga sp.]MBL4759634.1 hypothetical protein [Mariprofundaceae bacterium]